MTCGIKTDADILASVFVGLKTVVGNYEGAVKNI